MHPEILSYAAKQTAGDKAICIALAIEIDRALPEAQSKLWHAHPVWFLDGNPVVGFSKQKLGIRLMFWSGADFGSTQLNVVGKKFKDASVFYNYESEIHQNDLRSWLKLAREIQWDYKNIVKRKGRLELKVITLAQAQSLIKFEESAGDISAMRVTNYEEK